MTSRRCAGQNGRNVRCPVRPEEADDLALLDVEVDAVHGTDLEVHRPTLDDVFLTLTGRSLRDAASAAERADDDTAQGMKTSGPADPAQLDEGC